MIVAITGDRNWERSRLELIEGVLALLDPAKDFVVLGDARGVDALAMIACENLGLPHKPYRADWGRYGRGAGPLRNRAMLNHPGLDVVWYFHDDLEHSRGTKNMVNQACDQGVPVRNGQEITESDVYQFTGGG